MALEDVSMSLIALSNVNQMSQEIILLTGRQVQAQAAKVQAQEVQAQAAQVQAQAAQVVWDRRAKT